MYTATSNLSAVLDIASCMPDIAHGQKNLRTNEFIAGRGGGEVSK
jgi:hypothetical protein